MTGYTPNDNFPGVNIYDTTDPVLGGTTGESNNPVEALADRTQWLKNRMGKFLGQRIITSASSVTVADLFKIVKINAGGNITITLDSVATFPVGAIIPFKIKCPDKKAVTIQPSGAETIEDGRNNWAPFWACDGEEFKLIAIDADNNGTADLWLLLEPKGNFDIAGEDALVRILPRNTIIANGCQPEISGALYLRADFPRLWNAVSGIAIADVTWLADPVSYRAYFSDGNGTTTFRVPDLRSLFQRALDLGRGLDVYRPDNTPGSYEVDTVKVPDGVKGVKVTGNSTVTSVDSSNPGGQEFDLQHVYDISTGAETKPKNYGKTPVIFY